MTNKTKFNCTETSPEELLLLAYGERSDPRLTAHVKHCACCQAYLQDVRATRAQVRLPLASPAGPTLAAVLRRAEALADHRAQSPAGWAGRAWAALFARPFAPALTAAAALVVMVAGLAYLQSRPVSRTGTGPAVDYLTGVSSDLLIWDKALDAEAASAGGAAVEDVSQPDNLNELELAAAGVERDLPLMNYSDLAAVGEDHALPCPKQE